MPKKPTKTNVQKIQKPTTLNYNKVTYIALGFISIIFIYFCFSNKFIQDDAYISFRYIQNFISGNGLVFNIGEKVEGYTNLLWVLILSIFAFLKFNVENVAQILSVAFGIVVLFVTYKISDIIEIKNDMLITKKSKYDSKPQGSVKYLDFIPLVLLIFTASYIFWSVSGMESTMFISFCLFGIYYYIKNRNTDIVNYKFSIFLVLATLTRPEGLYFFGLIIIHKVMIAFRQNKSSAINSIFSKNNLITYALYIVPIIFYFLLRYLYYGYLLPNTYYAKTGLSSAYLNAGIEYFTKFLTSYLIYGIVLIAPLYLFKRRENFFEISLLYLLSVSFILYTILIGGDVLKQNRFFLPVLPLIYILFGKFLTELYFLIKIRWSSPGAAFPAVLIITAFLCFYYYSSQKENLEKDIASENGLVDKMKISGSWFMNKQQQLGRPLNIAATTIGAVSYFAGVNVNVIDLLGLTDKEIAHNPKIIPEISANEIGWKERNYNADYVMSRDPDYIYFSTGVKPSAYAERALYTTGEFMKYYYPYYFNDRSKNFTDVVYKRKSEDELKDKKWEFPGNPNYKLVYVNMFNQAMNTFRDKSKAQTALSEFKKSLEIGPSGFGLPYQYIGDIYLQMGNKREAIESYKRAVEIDDYNVIAHYQLYQLYSELGDTSNALTSIQKIQKYDPEILK